jgi:hydrogenase maturation protein HypF
MPIAPPHSVERRRILVRGVVQGVGFRPFVHNLARDAGLTGFVQNDGAGVTIEIQGEARALDEFVGRVADRAPPLARVESLVTSRLAPREEPSFVIQASGDAGSGALIPADVATCDDCLRELFDRSDRRYRYPFINCTQCGPRFTIVRASPYDRVNTTMAGFSMCADCRREYEDPADRRFHAEPIACPACGPRLSMPLDRAIGLLHEGKILAVKGLGGYHLACDAANETAVARLRARKHREEKPFAVMAADPHDQVELTQLEAEMLRGPDRPIVLARRRPDAAIAASVAPGNPWLGVMLPYTPLHHLLLADFAPPLVMTSGNRSDEPIAFDNDDAHRRLAGVADAFLEHDRPIHRRCEDSVVRAEFPVRRSRGRAPRAIPLPYPASRPLVATGAELKSTFCVARGDEAFLSAHLGDLDNAAAYRAFGTDLELYRSMLGVEPEVFACDMHPDYLASKWAREQAGEVVEIQHHHAHAAACLAEHCETRPALALVFDGNGYGPDGTLWGGELLRCNLNDYVRLAHLRPVALPGGEAAIRAPWRVAGAYLEIAERPVPFADWALVRESMKVNAPLSSGMGRLFDAVAALLGVRATVSYEGQAAIELERLAGDTIAEPYRCSLDGGVIAGPELVASAYDDHRAGRPRAEIAAAFHEGVAAAAIGVCAQAGGPKLVVLSGGTFQNLRLVRSVRTGLESLGFTVLTHRRVPPNDGGISYGQAAIAARRTRCA